MATWIAFVRAINLGKRTYPMAELRSTLTDAGFDDVETHIQTGNVRFRTRRRSPERIVEALERAMTQDRGFEVQVVLFTPDELDAVVAEAEEYAAGEHVRGHYCTLLATQPSAALRRQVEEAAPDGELVKVGDRTVHLLLTGRGYHEATTSNAALEKRLGLGTTRNLTVMRALAQKWGSGSETD